MSAMDAMNREQKKRQLKRRMIEPGMPPPADSGELSETNAKGL